MNEMYDDQGRKLIAWTAQRRDGLRRAYKRAITEGKKCDGSFLFEDDWYNVGYAKYLLEYLDGCEI